MFESAAVVELADTLDLGSSEKSCRFKSCQPHQSNKESKHKRHARIFYEARSAGVEYMGVGLRRGYIKREVPQSMV